MAATITTTPWAGTLTDTRTMLRRNLVHQLRYPSLTLMLVGMPVLLLLVFVSVFGATMGAGLEAAGAGSSYVNYVVPGILLIGIASGAQGTAMSVAGDMTEGIVARFRTMAISRAAVLNGHVIGCMVQTLAALMLVVGVALLAGFRPTATAVEWVAAAGVLLLITFAITWFSVALGTVADSVEVASNTPMPLILLPFLGSGFVPADSMPAAVQWFAQVQPFTPFMETLRGLLTGTAIGINGWLTIAWCVAIAAGSYLWARSAYERKSVR